MLLRHRPAINRSTAKPGGALLQLPCELRHQIYRYCLNKPIPIFWSYHDQEHYDKQMNPGLAILRLSKAISSDFNQLLSSRAASRVITSKYSIQFDTHKFSTPPSKEATDLLTSIEFKVTLNPECLPYGSKDSIYPGEADFFDSRMDRMCEATVDRFTGTAIVRDNLRVHILVPGPDSYQYFDSFMEARFFQTLKKLTGFWNLTLVVQLAVCNDYEVDLQAANVASGVERELKNHLGPFVVKSMTHHLVERFEEKEFDLTLELEFHPLKFHIDNPPAEATKSIKRVDSLREQNIILEADRTASEGIGFSHMV